MNIPFNNFQKEYKAHKIEVNRAIQKVLKSGYYILGPELENFEKIFSQYIGVKHTIGVANGMEALQISLMALGVGKGDEVITTSLSAVATALAIVATGATPVFVDVDEYYHIDPKEIEKKITPKTKAIIPVHLYGQAVNMEDISRIAKKHSLYVIEDCAQAVGTKYKNKKQNSNVGSLGILGCFSFYPTKNLGAYGDGGAITTNDDSLAEKIKMMRNYGQKNRYEHTVYGLNSRLDELQAGILSAKLQTLENDNEKRNDIADLYRKELENITGIRLPKIRRNSTHIYHLFVIAVPEKRDTLQVYLKEKGIATLIHYPIPIHKQKVLRKFNSLNLPKTEKYSASILSLPCNPYLTTQEVLYICSCIKSFFVV